MNDKQWLELVSVAYKEYQKQETPSLDIEKFITWLYKQYGIIETKGNK